MNNFSKSKYFYFGFVCIFFIPNVVANSRVLPSVIIAQKEPHFPYSMYEIIVVELKRREGFSSTPYRDGDGWAIGYGQHYKIYKDLPSFPIGEKKATKMLQETLAKELAYIKKLFPNFNDYQHWALLSLSYNIGLTKMKTNSVFWEALNNLNLSVLKEQWLSAFGESENKQKSRNLEWALFSQDLQTVENLHLEAKTVLMKRYAEKKDFALKK